MSVCYVFFKLGNYPQARGTRPNVEVGKGRKKVLVTAGIAAMEFGKGCLEQIAQKDQRPAVQALRKGFGRYVNRFVHLGGFRR